MNDSIRDSEREKLQILAEIRIAAQEFEAELSKHSLSSARSPAGRRYNLRQALEGLDAAHTALMKLAEASVDIEESRSYLRAMRALRVELKELEEQILRESEAEYKPLTEAFKASASTLKKAKRKAEQMAAALGLAADVISAFSRLVAVI